MRPTVLITGASGNLGAKLRSHLEGRGFDLRLLDVDPRGDRTIAYADLSTWLPSWVDLFRGVDTVVHLAADPTAHQSWEKLVGPNIDAVVHVYQAAAARGVRRVVFASSNHVMGGYQDVREPFRITTDLPPRPGARYIVEGKIRDSSAYGSAKLFGERVGMCFAQTQDIETVALRVGWVRPGENRAADIPAERGEWFRLMWLSNRDFCTLAERAIAAELSERFVVCNGMSDNTGMRWDIETTRRILGWQPADDVASR